MNKLPHIYYINLKHRVDRKNNIEQNLKSVNYEFSKVTRIDAIKNKIGTLGCLASHIIALKEALNNNDGLEYSIILEDDFIFRPELNKTIIQKTLLDCCFNTNIEWNVVLLAMHGRVENPEYLNDKSKSLLKIKYSQTTSGYLIKKKYIPILLNLWENLYEKTKNCTSIPDKNLHMDIIWIKLQKDNWYVTNPKLGIQYQSYSDIENKVINYNN
jgi:GR25 family glycosyltransferase involved in LPS biosynthesis